MPLPPIRLRANGLRCTDRFTVIGLFFAVQVAFAGTFITCLDPVTNALELRLNIKGSMPQGFAGGSWTLEFRGATYPREGATAKARRGPLGALELILVDGFNGKVPRGHRVIFDSLAPIPKMRIFALGVRPDDHAPSLACVRTPDECGLN